MTKILVVANAEAEFKAAQDATRTARNFEIKARQRLVDALAAEAGLEVGDKITVDPTSRHPWKAFVTRFTLTKVWAWEETDREYRLDIHYTRARKDGTPYAKPNRYPTGSWVKGWGDEELSEGGETNE